MFHKHSIERASPRAAKRLAISADSAEREARGLPLNPALSQPYPVPKAWLTAFPLDPVESCETEKEDKSGGHAGERSGQSDALQWNEPELNSTSASSANGSKDATNAETTLDEELGE